MLHEMAPVDADMDFAAHGYVDSRAVIFAASDFYFVYDSAPENVDVHPDRVLGNGEDALGEDLSIVSLQHLFML